MSDLIGSFRSWRVSCHQHRQDMTFATVIATQGAAEYTAITAHNAVGAPENGVQQAIDGARDFLATHTVVVVLVAVALFLLYRFVFGSPRVR